MNGTKTGAKPFVFTLMPFHNDFDDIYKLGIKETCEKAGTYCERVDEQIYEESMLERIYNQINKADIIVADLTTKNPNVFYELGYAHALNKRVILIIQDISEVPFDLKHHPFIVYGKSIQTLQKELKRKLTYFKNNPETTLIPSTFDFEITFGGTKVVEGGSIDAPWGFYGGTKMWFDLQNISNQTYTDLQVGLQTTKDFPSNKAPEKTTVITQSDGSLLYLSKDKIMDFYPSSYRTIFFYLDSPLREEDILGMHKFTFKIFTPFGLQNTNFNIKLLKSNDW